MPCSLAYLIRSQLWHIMSIHKNMFMGHVISSHFKDWLCPVKFHVIWYFWQKNPKKLSILYIYIYITAHQRRMGPPKKKANSAGRTSKRRRISEETVSPRNDEIHDQSSTDPTMVQSITAAVTKSGNNCRSQPAWHSKHYAARRSNKPCSSRSTSRQWTHPDNGYCASWWSTTDGIFHYNSQQFRTSVSYVICKHNPKTRWYEWMF